ncbi:hypothetical protein D9611_006778 [Ephemerocybe angulata]|uniref:RRM domain-containing protein n=1 Tax=Ephemerocybe angulata TaxID=980116 RepID=A0A8H5AZK8_9AGAR|nr:hypothetical protein D9611_006778 [Tulosesus angulatus]
MDVDKSPTVRSSVKSPSQERDKKDRRRERGDEERRRRSRSKDRGSERMSERSYRDRDRSRDRNRERSDRDRPDRDRRRDRDADRHRGSNSNRDRERERERDREREDRDRDRRRKRPEDDEVPDKSHDDRSKRKRSDDGEEAPPPPTGAPPAPPRGSVPPRGSAPPEVALTHPTVTAGTVTDAMAMMIHLGTATGTGGTGAVPVTTMIETGLDDPGPGAQWRLPSDVELLDLTRRPQKSITRMNQRKMILKRDPCYFFEDKLGDNTVMDARIVTDRLSRRSKGIGYVEFRSIELVEKAIALSGTIVMGLPIMVQLTESERNKTHAGDGSLHLPPGVTASHGAMQLYVGSLHFNLTESDIRQVFEPFGELEFVDLHRDPTTGRSKGYAFVQYKKPEDARMALEQMEGFELAGRTLRVNTVHEKGSTRYTQQDSLEESGGGNLNAASRQALMQKLARTEQPAVPEPINKPNIPQNMQFRSVLLKNMFDPEEETEPNWDKDLAEDVKVECETKYGPVTALKVERDSQGEIYAKFESIDSAKAAIQGLNGRWFGGRQITATFISDAIMQAHQ